MYAILEQGGHQYLVSPGDRLVVDRLGAEVGDVVELSPVLLLGADGEDGDVGSPTIAGARVTAVVVGHPLGRKLRVFKYKPKKRYRRTQGHRSRLTELRIEALLGKGEAPPPRRRAGRKGDSAAKATSDAEVAAEEAPTPRRRRTRAASAASAGTAAAQES